MVTSIQLGNLSQQNGRNVITGSSSGGIDTKALMEALAEAKRLPAVQLESRMEANTAKSTAYGEMKDILNRFQDAANFLRNPPGVGNSTEDVFRYRNSTITNSGATAASTYLSVNVEPGAPVSTYEVTVGQLATFNTKITNTFALTNADTDAVDAAGPFIAGTYTFGASAQSVTIGANDTLNQIAAKINAVSSQSKVAASVVKVSDGNYRLSLKTTETGAALNYATPAGFALGGWASEIDAVNAQMTIDGTPITRSKNTISDAINGMTFSLTAVTPPGDELTVGVAADQEVVKSAIFNFVDAYNEFRIFAAKQMETGDDGKPLETAILNNSSTMRSTLARVNTEVASVVDGLTAGDPDRLADIGITFNDFPGDEETPFVRNVLNIDEDKLEAAIAGDFEAVRKVFAFDYSSTDPNLTVFRRTNGLDVSSITLNIQYGPGIFEATYMDGATPVYVTMETETLSSGAGVIMRGPAGTPLEGLELIYSSLSDNFIDLDLSQGVADRVHNTLGSILDEDQGMLTTELESIEDSNTRLQTEIDRIDSVVEKYREQLLKQFSALERAISQANTLLQSLNAQANARLAAG